MKHKEPETLTEQLYMAQDIILQTRDNLIRGIIDFLKPEPMTVLDLNMQALYYYAFAGLFLAFGALLLATIALIRTEKNPAIHPTLPYLVFTFVLWAMLTFALGLIASLGATWRRHQGRKTKPNPAAVKEVFDGIVAKFPEAPR